MEDDARPLDDLAEDVLEGRLVDWTSAESSPDPRRREAVRQLKVLAGIAGIHRSVASGAEESPELETWGRLKILERIGRGSFGDVYRAWDTKLDREVALKLLRAESARLQGAEVLREARLLARVRHPNVATVYDADEIGGRVGLWMEFIHGRNLEQILVERRSLDEPEATRIGIEVCRAIAAVHEAGLLHRDIKAQNVMQAENGRLILMDFGTGRESGEPSSSTVDAAGTPLYVAPEVLAGAPATVQTDIYSFGVLLFHLLTGAYPVRGSTLEDVHEAHTRGERLTLAAACPGVTRPLAAVVSRALEPAPSRRFESATAALEALETAHRARETRNRRRAGLALSAIVLAAIGVVAVWSPRRLDATRDGSSSDGHIAYFGSSAQKRAVHTPKAMFLGVPSPDGRLLPYSELGTGNLALYEFSTGASRVLTNTADGGDGNYATSAIVSADGHTIAYGWEDGVCHCSQLRVIHDDGTSEHVLYGAHDADEIVPIQWSSDGSRILGSRRHGPDKTDLVLVSVADGAVHLVRTVSSSLGIVGLSPDDRFVAYDRWGDSAGSGRGIYLSSTEGDREIPVVKGPTFNSDPMWTPDGSALVFSSTRTSGPGLWLEPIKDGQANGKPRLLDKEMGPFGPITLTKGGSLFYSHRTGLMDVYTAPIDPATGDIVGEPSNAASHAQGSNIYADWSPDGRTLVFASWRSAKRNILVFHSLETGTEREFELDVVANGVHWSPDGRSVALGGGLVDVESGRVATTPLASRNSFVWDLDANHGYVGRLGGERPGISRADVSTGEEHVLYRPPTDSVLGNLSLSPDGRSLAFGLFLQSTKTAQLLVVPTAGGRPRELFSLPNASVALGIGGWTRDGRRILFVQTTQDSEQGHVGELWAVSLDGGTPRRLGLSMRALRDVRVSPDGTRISFTSGYPETDLWVFENFLPRTGSP